MTQSDILNFISLSFFSYVSGMHRVERLKAGRLWRVEVRRDVMALLMDKTFLKRVDKNKVPNNVFLKVCGSKGAVSQPAIPITSLCGARYRSPLPWQRSASLAMPGGSPHPGPGLLPLPTAHFLS